MADSENNSAQPEGKPAVTEELMLHAKSGKYIKNLRGEGGKFVRQPKAMPSSREFTRLTRNYMLQMEAGADGKILKGSKTKYEMMCENIISIARRVPTVLPNGDTIEREAKEDMAAVQAFKVYTERGLGQPPKSDEEQDALKEHGIKMVVIVSPELMHKEIVDFDKPKPQLKPSFINAEIIENKS